MTLAIADIATATSITSTSTLVVPGVTAAIGDLLVLFAGADNADATGLASLSTVVTDSKGNSWSNRKRLNRAPSAAANSGTTLGIWICNVTVALSSDDVTLSFSPATTAKVAQIYKITGASPIYKAIATGVTGNGTAIAPANVNVLYGLAIIGVTSIEANAFVGASSSDTDTTNGSWSTAVTTIADVGTSATSQSVRSQYKIVTADGVQSYDITLSSAQDYCTCYIIVGENCSRAVGSGVGDATGSSRADTYSLVDASGLGAASATLASEYTLLACAKGVGIASAARGIAVALQGTASGEGATALARGVAYNLTAQAEGIGFATGFHLDPKVIAAEAALRYWQGFPGPAGYVDFKTWGLFPVDTVVSPVVARNGRGLGYLLRLSLPLETEEESYETIYPAASFGRSTTPDDTPASSYVPGLLLGSTINYGVSLFGGIEPTASESGGQGVITLVDTRGVLDTLIDKPLDGAKLEILQGDPKAKFNTFSIVAKVTTAGILYDQRKKEIRLRDQSWRLNQGRIHDDTYTGEGDANGDASLKGQYKPYGIGLVRNTEPVLINADRQIRQLSNGKIEEVLSVKDGGLELTFSGIDYPNYAALAAAADAEEIEMGEYSTCLNEGFIATGAVPQLQLTADFKGDAEVFNGVGYVDTIALICYKLVTARGNIKLLNTEIDFASMNKLAQTQPGVSGWWWPGGSDLPTKAAALKEIMDSRLGWWAVRLNGLLAFGVMEEPGGAPAMVVNYPDDFAGEPAQLDTYQVPRYATFLGYKRNYTIQNASQLLNAVEPIDRIIYAQESLFQSVQSTVPLWKIPTAQTIRIQSGLDDAGTTLAECRRQQGIMGQRRERWTIPIACDAFADLLGKVIEIRNFPRYGWGSSRKFICIGQSFASGIAVRLVLWG